MNPIRRSVRTLNSSVEILREGATSPVHTVRELARGIFHLICEGEARIVVVLTTLAQAEEAAFFTALESIPIQEQVRIDLTAVRDVSLGILGILSEEHRRRKTNGSSLVALINYEALSKSHVLGNLSPLQLEALGAEIIGRDC